MKDKADFSKKKSATTEEAKDAPNKREDVVKNFIRSKRTKKDKYCLSFVSKPGL